MLGVLEGCMHLVTIPLRTCFIQGHNHDKIASTIKLQNNSKHMLATTRSSHACMPAVASQPSHSLLPDSHTQALKLQM